MHCTILSPYFLGLVVVDGMIAHLPNGCLWYKGMEMLMEWTPIDLVENVVIERKKYYPLITRVEEKGMSVVQV